MRLHLECIDSPDQAKHYIPEFSQIEAQTFEGKRIHIDNHQYGNCHFVNCTFVYSGGPFGFHECTVEGDLRLGLTGSAYRTNQFVDSFREYQEERRRTFPLP